MTDIIDEVARFEDAIRAHDQLVAKTGIAIWIGAEPTFSDRFSTDPQWQTTALGGDKEAKARQFSRQIASQTPGCMLLRTLGRQYPGEALPRWNIGIYSRRDQMPVWSGPLDPMLAVDAKDSRATRHEDREIGNAFQKQTTCAPPDSIAKTNAERLRTQLANELREAGFAVELGLPADSWGVRLLFAEDEKLLQEDWSCNGAATRPPVQSQPIPVTGTIDHLSARGVYLVAIGQGVTPFEEDRNSTQVELPDFGRNELWQTFMDALCRASMRCELKSLMLTGFPPPVDENVSWTTVTPDPGVIEVNMAPCSDIATFYRVQQQLHRAAEEIGLSSFKLLFNGEVVDSGGGQHLTFGGHTPDASPFFQCPRLLPRLVAYLNRHPSLSYWFAVRSVGSCGQQPRADEVSPESIDGLAVSLDRLFQSDSLTPDLIWRSLYPFLCDRFGNTHRCEVNVEKLWNVNSPPRGCLGLVELRAFRMTRSAEDAVAIAILMRTIVAWLSTRADTIDLVEWGTRLHDRFALPYYLLQDLEKVFSDIKSEDFGIDDSIIAKLTNDSHVVIGTHELGTATMTIRQAIEFWPVIASADGEERSFRMMDSSTSRLELLIELPKSINNSNPEDWRLIVQGFYVPWVVERETSRTVLLRGIRYKAFHPQTTVSPLVHVIDPVEFTVANPSENRAWLIRVFNWEPNQKPYDGLPSDMKTAQHRRSERVVVDEIKVSQSARPIHSSALTEHCVDLRRI